MARKKCTYSTKWAPRTNTNCLIGLCEVKDWQKYCASTGIGAFFGTIAFWTALAVVTSNSPTAVLKSYSSIVLADAGDLNIPGAKLAATVLQESGLGISADSYFGRITEFYGILLQVALAAFVLFGFFSFLAIRWQSIRAAEEMVDAKVVENLNSELFDLKLARKATAAFDLNAEPLEEQIRQLSGLVRRIEAVEARVAENASEEEPDESGGPEFVSG